jgi:hypothetical protein
LSVRKRPLAGRIYREGFDNRRDASRIDHDGKPIGSEELSEIGHTDSSVWSVAL